mmetsp:Transcript_21643/g.46846  ORF Transcript_21643/g.46846 Transcript_21643/m.46846 type:complete len:240 (+) Transcript_21643:1153-1872(+)
MGQFLALDFTLFSLMDADVVIIQTLNMFLAATTLVLLLGFVWGCYRLGQRRAASEFEAFVSLTTYFDNIVPPKTSSVENYKQIFTDMMGVAVLLEAHPWALERGNEHKASQVLQLTLNFLLDRMVVLVHHNFEHNIVGVDDTIARLRPAKSPSVEDFVMDIERDLLKLRRDLEEYYPVEAVAAIQRWRAMVQHNDQEGHSSAKAIQKYILSMEDQFLRAIRKTESEIHDRQWNGTYLFL